MRQAKNGSTHTQRHANKHTCTHIHAHTTQTHILTPRRRLRRQWILGLEVMISLKRCERASLGGLGLWGAGQGSRVIVEGEGGSGGGWRGSGDVNRDISYVSKTHATKQRQSKRGSKRGKLKSGEEKRKERKKRRKEVKMWTEKRREFSKMQEKLKDR